MRIAILGNSGSGKSTLAKRLALTHSVPHLDLDSIAWEPNAAAPTLRALDRVVEDLHPFCRATDGWVLEGCYADVVGASLVFEPRLLFLNPKVEVCLEHARSRPWEPHKYASKAEQDTSLAFLLTWIIDYPNRAGSMGLAAHRELFDTYTGEKRELNDAARYDE